MSLEKRILDWLSRNKPAKAREIAGELGVERSEVNSHLYRLKNARKTIDDADHRWSLSTRKKSPQSVATSKRNESTENPSQEPTGDEMTLGATIQPTPEQVPVITASTGSRLMVEAGPGTGKTEVLVLRLKHLLGAGGLNPSEILVLSFSVAAVRELRSRIERARAGGDATMSFIDIRTFDSFASRFLRRFIAPNDLQVLNYDERILQATTALKTNKTATLHLKDFKHILLDETQDLVGVRADFALELLRVIKPGFTLFGDSAQGIYDFTVEGSPSRTTSEALLKSVRKEFPDLDDKHRFTQNFRVGGNSHLEKIARHGRTLLLKSPEKARVFLEKEFADLSGQGSTGNPQINSELLHRSTCVVCRTNGQVLRLAGQLQEKNIPFLMARDKNEFLAPAWIARVFLGWPDPTVRRHDFLVKAQSALSILEPQALQLWVGLVSSFGPPKAVSFNINDLRAAITDGVVMPEHPLYERNTNVIQLSTIHRSKGREFSNVIVVIREGNNGDQSWGDDTGPARGEDRKSDAAEPRVLFVALTRAKKSLHRMEAKAKGIWMPDERWIRSFPTATGFKTLSAIQVGLARDVDLGSFAVGGLADVVESQQWLLEKARPGTPVELWLNEVDKGCPIYKIMIAKCEVGRMSSNFGWAVWHTLKNLNGYKPKQFPKFITGVWVKEIITAVGNTGSDGIDHALLRSGLWMTLALEGLGKCEWK